jgi:ATP-dependent helicase/nuclease subunit A
MAADAHIPRSADASVERAGASVAVSVRALRALTEEQERAVASREGSLLLAAGAGSGKTSVLVERFVRAVREDGVAPGRILAITFTERAAGELRERIRARLMELGEREAAREAEAAFVSTFHGFCARLLRVHPLQAGVEPGFEIIEESFAARLRTLAFSDALADFLDGEPAEAVDLVAAYGADPLCKMVLGAYAQLRSQGQREPQLPMPRTSARGRAELPELAAQGESVAQNESAPRGESDEADTQRDEQAARACGLIGELLDRFGAAYARRKHARGALDFDDLELDARGLLERRRDVREAWAERFQLLMVDEFQDSNPRQLEIVGAIERDNLFTVGDELQSIYSFRHADVGLFRERHARLSERGASLALTRNFRSRPAILAAVERIFAERMGEHFAPLAVGRRDSEPERSAHEGDVAMNAPAAGRAEPIVELLLTDKRGWENVAGRDDLDDLPDATPWRQAEARLLAARVAELVASGGARAGEIVVLLRSLGDLPVYEAALRAHELPTLAGVGGFWGHQQVGDLLAWLRVLANPLDELALYSVLASPLVGVSSDGLALIARAARERRGGVWQAIERAFGEQAVEREGQPDGGHANDELGGHIGRGTAGDAIDLSEALPEADRERLSAFRELFAAERAAMALHPIAELLRRAVLATGYDSHVLALDWGERRLANVHKLVSMARRFEAREGRDLRGFLDHVSHAGIAREADAPAGEGQLDAVRLMSIHAAKGLEFPVVCVADLGREPNLRTPDLLVDGALRGAQAGGRVGLRLLALGDPEPRSALDYERLREERREAQEEEEDRVLYVACTRAENRLLLSGAVAFGRWPEPKPGVAPIAWLAPALVGDAPKLAASERPPVGELTIDSGGGLLVRCVFNAPIVREAAGQGLGDGFGRESVLESGAGASELGDGAPEPVGRAEAPESIGRASELGERASESGAGALELGDGAPEPLGRAGAPGRGPAEGESVQAAPPRVPSLARPPLPLSDPDATMSYTSLSELERCGYRYYLERVLRLPENHAAARPSRPGREETGIDARMRGTIVHMLLELIDWARPRAPSERDVVLLAKRIGASVSPAECEEIAALIAGALAASPARELGAMGRARSEHPFSFSLGADQPLVTGVLDLIVERSDGTSTIVDYKSDRLTEGADLERLVLRDYGFQRLLYALAAIEDGAHEVEVAHWFLERPGEWVAARFVAEQRDRLREQLLQRILQVRARGFAVTDTPHRGICLTCPGRGGLCSWGETHTMSARSATLESGEIGGSLNF